MKAKKATVIQGNGGNNTLLWLLLAGGAGYVAYLLLKGGLGGTSLNGTVRSGEDGSVISGANVTVGTKTAKTGANGTFSITGLSAGTVAVNITAAGYISYSGTVVLVSGPNTKTFQLFTTTTTVGLSGKVTNINTGSPLPGATVSVAGRMDTTDANGNYSITGLSVGTFTVTFEKQWYRPKTVTKTLVAGANTLDMTMNNLGTANIHVEDIYDYIPISGAIVVVTGFPAKTSNSNGVVSFVNIPAGQYSGTATKTGYNTVNFSFTVYPEMTADVHAQLTKQSVNTGRVSGSVTNQAGNGISEATVNIGSYTTTTSLLGGYSIDVPPGTYTATASKEGYQSSSKTVTVHSGDAIVVDFILNSTVVNGVLHGFVTNASTGYPVEGALVWIPKPGGGSWNILTSNTGYYVLSLPPGIYSVTAEKSGYSEQVKTTSVYTNQATTLDFALQSSAVNLGFRMRISASFLANEFPGVSIRWSAIIGDAIAESFHGYFMPADSTWDKVGYDLTDPNIIQWPGWLTYYIYDASTYAELLHWAIQPITLQNGHLYEISGSYLYDMGLF